MKYALCLFLWFVLAFGALQDEVARLRWAGPPGSRPGTYEEWIREHPDAPFSYTLHRKVSGYGGMVAILTDSAIAPSLSNEIEQLLDNLQEEGYGVLSYEIAGGTPDTLRAFLKNLRDTHDIEGALFIGDLPVAWFEVHDFGDPSVTDFPMDIFYMDLNGTWLDTISTGNGKYDGHIGAISPEIYIGRLMPTAIGNDTMLLKNYFRKDNAFRRDTLLLQKRALVFVDDDWEYWGPQWAYEVALLYSDTMSYWNPETTRALVYRSKLDTVQAWVSVFAHSWPGGHQFRYDTTQYDYYYSSEYVSQDPPANFYNFFACSFSRYTEACGGNTAVFNQTSGVGSIGSTKTGSMLDFHYFYHPLSQGNTLGEAFKDWFTHITDYGVTLDELCWHYGMTLLGDPFLKPVGHSVAVEEYASQVIPNSLSILGNPVSRNLEFALTLAQQSDVTIALYDCIGRKMSEQRKTLQKGINNLALKMNDRQGNELPHGVYIVKVDTNHSTITKKIVKL